MTSLVSESFLPKEFQEFIEEAVKREQKALMHQKVPNVLGIHCLESILLELIYIILSYDSLIAISGTKHIVICSYPVDVMGLVLYQGRYLAQKPVAIDE
ncbi:MAG: hypothetical protein ACRD8W_06050 [Nitrososphaeraceae archaeon]